MKTFSMAKGLDLPSDAATQIFAFMGRRGSGKTYAAGRLIEQLLDADNQVVILDPVGVWHGLRLAADGKAPGFAIPIFGGIHGDIPLAATAGQVVAELVATRALSVVLDVSEFTGADQRRFVAEFCAEVFHAKKRHRSAVMIVFEEAQEFAPQHVSGETAKMVGAVERLIKLGRNFGVGGCLISQRPQAVNKDVLNLTEVMFALQLTGPQERKTIAGWVQEKGAGSREIADELPGLPVGEAMVWSPQWLRSFGRYKILPKRTFDASATPTGGHQAAPTLAPVDLQEVLAAMSASAEEMKANDPKELRAEIARLNQQVRRLTGDLDQARRSAPAPERVEVPVLPAGLRSMLEEFAQQGHEIRRLVTKLAEGAATTARVMGDYPEAQVERQRPLESEERRPVAEVPAPTPAPRPRATTVDGDLPKGARMMLEAVAARGSLTRSQMATLASMAPTGGTFQKYLSTLKTSGMIEVSGDAVTITGKGRSAAGDVRQPSGPGEVLALWRDKMPGKARDMLELFAAEHGPFTKDQLGKRLDLDPTGGTFQKYLSILRSNGLVRKGKGGLVVDQELAL
jgi:hypothetical protein